MSDALDKAEAAAREASTNTDIVRIVAAVLAAQQAVQQQPAPAPCQHQHDRRPGRSTGEWLAISCAVCVGGIGIAFASIAIAIGGISVAILALVLRSMWRDFQKGR
ncbi:hypothetical protein AB0I77_29585 [Streptomyces sp. NPDC050619]|uniref:hypothetical protein n=1 Tax=Streptomyces sp. NPDC050619 TaxID=3157214 RepID=UPI00343A0C3E